MKQSRIKKTTVAQPDSSRFHPELFEHRTRAAERLREAGFTHFLDYTSIDIEHDDYGLEVIGIPDEDRAKRIRSILEKLFPEWTYWDVRDDEPGDITPGWTVELTRDDRGLEAGDWWKGGESCQ